MYRHILIPTDGSELAEHAVTNGLSLAKSLGAKVTAIIVEEPFNWLGVWKAKAQRAFAEHGAFTELGKHIEQIKKYAASVLDGVADSAKQIGVPCDTIQVEDVHPYQAIISTAADRGCDLIVMASHGRSGLSTVVLGSAHAWATGVTSTPLPPMSGPLTNLMWNQMADYHRTTHEVDMWSALRCPLWVRSGLMQCSIALSAKGQQRTHAAHSVA